MLVRLGGAAIGTSIGTGVGAYKADANAQKAYSDALSKPVGANRSDYRKHGNNFVYNLWDAARNLVNPQGNIDSQKHPLLQPLPNAAPTTC